MKAATLAVGTVVDLELRQRVRSTAWYVLLAVSAVVLLVVTLLLVIALGYIGREGGRVAFSAIVFLVLLLGSLVTPALSGGAVNGDREAGTLATTQVTLVTAGQLLLGKFLAAWTASLAFLAVAVPFLLVAVLVSGEPIATALVSLLVLVLELGVIAAIGVGLSSLIQRTIFSVVVTYLVVAALSVGTLITFGLAGLAVHTRVTSVNESYADDAYDDDGDLVNPVCDPPTTDVSVRPRYDTVWWILAANPYVVLGDAVPTSFDKDGNVQDAFGAIKVGVRSVQIPPLAREVYSDCHPSQNTQQDRTPKQVIASTVPGWFVGLAIHLVLAVGALLLGLRALITPARRLARGSRIA